MKASRLFRDCSIILDCLVTWPCSLQTRPRRLAVGRCLLLLGLKLLTKSPDFRSYLRSAPTLCPAAPTLIITSLHSPECGAKAAFLKTNQLISLRTEFLLEYKLTFALFNDCYVTKQHMDCTVIVLRDCILIWNSHRKADNNRSDIRAQADTFYLFLFCPVCPDTMRVGSKQKTVQWQTRESIEIGS